MEKNKPSPIILMVGEMRKGKTMLSHKDLEQEMKVGETYVIDVNNPTTEDENHILYGGPIIQDEDGVLKLFKYMGRKFEIGTNHCIFCQQNILEKNVDRHNKSNKHLNNIMKYNPNKFKR